MLQTNKRPRIGGCKLVVSVKLIQNANTSGLDEVLGSLRFEPTTKNNTKVRENV